MKKYQIELTERQLQLLSYSCEKADRQIIGQLDVSLWHDCMEAWEREYKKDNGIKGILPHLPKEWHIVRGQVDGLIDTLRQLCWHQDRHTMYGVGYDNTADTLFDMHCVFRHAIWKEEPEDKRLVGVVSAYPHDHPYGSEPLAKIIKVFDDGSKEESKQTGSDLQ